MHSAKGFLVALVVIGIIGVKAWNSVPRYRESETMPLNVEAGYSFAWEFEMTRSGKLKFERTDMGDQEYMVYMMTKSEGDRMQALANQGEDISNFPTMFEKIQTGDSTFPDIEVSKDTYQFYVEPTGDSKLTGTLAILEYY